MCNYTKKNKHICDIDIYDTESYESKGYIYGNYLTSDMILNILKIIFNIHDIEFNKLISISYKNTLTLQLLIATTILPREVIEGLTLQSACIYIKNPGNHAISGIYINGVQYIYDSNGQLIKSNWEDIPFSPHSSQLFNKESSIKYRIYTN